jgi:hypothetical protein
MKNENLDKTFDCHPSEDDYCRKGMMRKKGEHFDSWYGPIKNTR